MPAGKQAGGSETGSADYGVEDDYEATQGQGYGLEGDDNDDTGELTRIVGGEAAGVAATLPDGLSVDILALGRLEQAVRRPRAGEEPLIVKSFVLGDSIKRPPQVSAHQHFRLRSSGAAIDELYFISVGRLYNFVNGRQPLHGQRPGQRLYQVLARDAAL